LPRAAAGEAPWGRKEAKVTTSHYLGRTARRGQLLAAGLLCGLCGCATFWEEITSRERDMSYVWRQPDPLVTLRDSTDNHRKAQAIMQLKEPMQHGGTREQQELYLAILMRAAQNEQRGQYEPTSRDPLCRLAAIRMLGEYKDPRALQVLEKAYFEPQPFTPDMNGMIRQQALASLEKNGNPDVRHILIRAARQPGAGPASSLAERQQILDEKLAAAKALGRYPQYDSIDTLVHILETEKDVALRDCAHQSLKIATNKDLPEDGKAWRDLLTRGEVQPQAQTGMLDRVVGFSAKTR
jgi:hypothetical protein